MHFPWAHLRPASITDHLELSIMIGTLARSGSEAMRLRKRVIEPSESSRAASKLMSITLAPLSTCCRAMERASSKFSSRTSRRKRGEPVMLVLSPTITRGALWPSSLRGSRPLSRVAAAVFGSSRGAQALTLSAMARICSGVVPQQPPTMLSSPSPARPPRALLVSLGVSS